MDFFSKFTKSEEPKTGGDAQELNTSEVTGSAKFPAEYKPSDDVPAETTGYDANRYAEDDYSGKGTAEVKPAGHYDAGGNDGDYVQSDEAPTKGLAEGFSENPASYYASGGKDGEYGQSDEFSGEGFSNKPSSGGFDAEEAGVGYEATAEGFVKFNPSEGGFNDEPGAGDDYANPKAKYGLQSTEDGFPSGGGFNDEPGAGDDYAKPGAKYEVESTEDGYPSKTSGSGIDYGKPGVGYGNNERESFSDEPASGGLPATEGSGGRYGEGDSEERYPYKAGDDYSAAGDEKYRS